jgi:hypothetical protein
MTSIAIMPFERVYKNALYYELKENVFKIETPKRIKVNYKEIEVVDYSAPIVVDGKSFRTDSS